MAKSIKLSSKEWTQIRKRIREDYSWKPSILIIREVMKRELGFTTRVHQTWSHQHGTVETMYLDFFDDNMETLFRLKYL